MEKRTIEGLANGISLAVIGSREFCLPENKQIVYSVLDLNKHKISLIVSGGAQGPDTFAEEWAKQTHIAIPFLGFYAKWKLENGEKDKGAGFRRNWHIVRNCDCLLAFWDYKSHGTANSIEIAKQLNKKIIIYDIRKN